MNEHDVGISLQAIHRRRAAESPSSLQQRLRRIDFDDIPEQRRWLPHLPPWRFPSMLTATKFVVAGAVVALFGGYLLSGVLTQPNDEPLPPAAASASASSSPGATNAPEQSVRSDLLAGVDLVTEEVEPGVYRVLGDGVRDLTRTFGREDDRAGWALGRSPDVLTGQIVAGLDGSVWLTWPDGLFRLGQDATHAWYRPKNQAWRVDDTEVGPDGTLWTVRGGRSQQLMSFDGHGWSVRKQGIPNRDVLGVEIQSDGTVWAAWENEPNKKARVGRLDGEDWDVLPGRVPGPGWLEGGGLAVAVNRADEIWIQPDFVPVQRHDGKGWIGVETPAGGQVELDVGPDGTVWLRLSEDCGPGSPGTSWDEETQSGESCGPVPSSILARLRDGEWTRYDESDGVPMLGDFGPYGVFPAFFEVAPDGRLWVNPFDPAVQTTGFDGGEVPESGCQGVASFDGVALRSHLSHLCVYDLEISPDGDVWVLAGPRVADPAATTDSVETYVITSEAGSTLG